MVQMRENVNVLANNEETTKQDIIHDVDVLAIASAMIVVLFAMQLAWLRYHSELNTGGNITH